MSQEIDNNIPVQSDVCDYGINESLLFFFLLLVILFCNCGWFDEGNESLLFFFLLLVILFNKCYY
ncbi:hypothetical protein [Brassicibacter mesophilus]|jgi:hypothetical protein|uniref:hypothetical protein n=1 Tax=Brassicibacter mesophilus TaxID=745119 RepID=UPI003D1B1A49